MSSDNLNVSLSRPLDVAGQTLSTLTLRIPTCSDMSDLSWGDLYAQLGDAYRTLIPRICTDGISVVDLDRLAASDLLELYSLLFLCFAAPSSDSEKVEQKDMTLEDINAERVTLALSVSFDRMDGKRVESVTLRTPTAADLTGISFGKIYQRQVSTYRTLIPRLTDDLDMEDMDSLHPFDLFELMAITFLFFRSRPDSGLRAPAGILSAQ